MKFVKIILVSILFTSALGLAQSSSQKFHITETDTFYLKGSFNNWQPIMMGGGDGEYYASFTFSREQLDQFYEWKVVRSDGKLSFPQSGNSWVYPRSQSDNMEGDSLEIYFYFSSHAYNDEWDPKSNIVKCEDIINEPDVVTDEKSIRMWPVDEIPGGASNLKNKADFVGVLSFEYMGPHWWIAVNQDYWNCTWGKENRELLDDTTPNRIPFETKNLNQAVYFYFDSDGERLATFVAPRTLQMKISPPEAKFYSSVYPYSNEGYNSEGYTGWQDNTNVNIKASSYSDFWKFKEWTGDVSGSVNPMNIVMDKDKVITAIFKPVLRWKFIADPAHNYCPPDEEQEVSMGDLKLSAGSVDWVVHKITFTELEKVKAENTEAKLFCNGNEYSGVIYSEGGNIKSVSFNLNNLQIKAGKKVGMYFYYKLNFPSKHDEFYLSGALDEVKKYHVSICGAQIEAEALVDSLNPAFIEPEDTAKSNVQTFASVWNMSKNPALPFASIYDAVNSSETKSGDKIKICPGVYKEKVTIEKPLTLFAPAGPDSTIIKALTQYDPVGDDDNVFIVKSDTVKITGLKFVDSFNGVNIDGEDKRLKSCEIANNVFEGGALLINNSDSIVVHKNVLASGVIIKGNRNIIYNNKIVLADRTGQIDNALVITDSSLGNVIESNIIGGAPKTGLWLKGKNVTQTEIKENVIGKKGSEGAFNNKGILIEGSLNNHIFNNFVSENSSGIVLGFKSGKNVVEENIIGEATKQAMFKNLTGITILRGSRNNLIKHNAVSMNYTGVYVESQGNRILQNLVGLDTSRTKAAQNSRGIVLANGAVRNIVAQNIISGNSLIGVWLKGKGTRENLISNNVIGGGAKQKESGANLTGIRISAGAVRNTISNNTISGNSSGIFLENAGTENNHIFRNIIGKDLKASNVPPNEKGILSYGSFFNDIGINEIVSNKTGIFEAGGRNFISGNNIRSNTGNTGLHFINFSRSIVTGNRITEDVTDGIKCESGASPQVNENDIFDNGGYGLFNTDARSQVDARFNYWGTSSEPADTIINGNVDFSNWYADPLAFVSSINRDTVYLSSGKTDSVYVFYENLVHRSDVFTINLSDEKDWLLLPKTITDSAKGFLGIPVKVKLSIPSGTADKTIDKVFLEGKSFKENLTRKDTIVVIIYTPELKKIKVLPDSLVITPQDSLRFGALGFDQYNHYLAVDPTWNASSGSIDESGMFLPKGALGEVTITATDKSSPVSGSATIVVDTAATKLTKVVVIPDTVTLNPGESFLFRAKGYNQHNFPQFFLPQWSANGGTIGKSGLYHSDTTTGVYSVIVNDTSKTLADTAVVIVKKLSGVKKESIPTKYYLSQNYPNPFNPTTTIEYSLPFASRVRIDVFNVLGQRIKTLVNKIQKAGQKRIVWNANNFATGVYFIRIFAEPQNKKQKAFTDVKKMVLLK